MFAPKGAIPDVDGCDKCPPCCGGSFELSLGGMPWKLPLLSVSVRVSFGAALSLSRCKEMRAESCEVRDRV